MCALPHVVNAHQPPDFACHHSSCNESVCDCARERCRKVCWLSEFSALHKEAAILLVEAATTRGIQVDPESLKRLDKALAAYDDATKRLAGSRSRLVKRIERTLAASASPGSSRSEEAELAQRQTLFEASAALTGRASDVWLAAHIYTPVPDHPDVIAQTRAHGLIGHRADTHAVPLTFHVFGEPDETKRNDLTTYRPLRKSGIDGIPDDDQVGDVDDGDSGGILPGFTAITGLASVLGAAILVSGRRKD